MLRARLAAYELPRRLDVVDAIPRTENGKVDRPAVASHFEGHRREPDDAASAPSCGPGSPTTRRREPRTATASSEQRRWQRTLHDAGWAGLAWPTEFGGSGASPRQQLIFHEEYERAGGNELNLFFVGLSHAGPTIIAHGTDEQRARFLPAILRGDLLFCQCFSEPDAGSDLAAVRTKAVVDGDHLVITGEKRWSTHAQYADRTEMLVRTDPVEQARRPHLRAGRHARARRRGAPAAGRWTAAPSSTRSSSTRCGCR